MRIDRSFVIAALILVLAAAWILSGQFIPSEGHTGPSSDTPRTAAVETKAPSPGAAETPAATPQSQAAEPGAAGGSSVVRVRTFKAVSRKSDVILRGHAEAERKVEVKTETAGTVAAVPVDEGSAVKMGDVLCELEVKARQAMLNQAKARMREAQLKYEGSRQLVEKGYRSETAVATDQAVFQGAKAEVQRMEEELENTKLRAPFDGVVDRRSVEVGDYMNVGATCALVIDEDPFLVIGNVSERDVGALSIGDPGVAKLITGQVVQGKIRFVGKTADPATRTFRVELEVPNPEHNLRDGVTAEIRVSTKTIDAHQISPAILALDEAGRVGVRIVEKDVVQFVPVTIISDDKDGVWVSGLPDTVTIITVGQEYVSAGQKVQTVKDEGGGPS